MRKRNNGAAAFGGRIWSKMARERSLKNLGSIQDEDYSTELARMLQKTEFENKQVIKAIELEKQQTAVLKKELELRPKQIKEVEISSRRLEEEVKRLHKQLTQSVAMTEAMKKSNQQLDQQIEALQTKLDNMRISTAQEAEEHKKHLEKYQALWEDYEKKYNELPKAKEVKRLRQVVEELTAKKLTLVQKREALEKTISQHTNKMNTDGGAKPRWTDWYIKMATLMVEITNKKTESKKIHQTIQKMGEENEFLKQTVVSQKTQLVSATYASEDEANLLQISQDDISQQEQYKNQGDASAIEVTDDSMIAYQDQLPIVEMTSQGNSQSYQQELQTQSQQSQPEFTLSNNSLTANIPTFNMSAFGAGVMQQSPQSNFFAGFGQDMSSQPEGISTSLQLTSEPHASVFSPGFSFTSPGGANSEASSAVGGGMSCFGSPASTSGAQEGFSFTFAGSQTPAKTSGNVFSFF